MDEVVINGQRIDGNDTQPNATEDSIAGAYELYLIFTLTNVRAVLGHQT